MPSATKKENKMTIPVPIPIPNAECICGSDNHWILWDNLLICDACGEAYIMLNNELIHPVIFNDIREERLQK